MGKAAVTFNPVEEAERQAWVKGYRAALDDFQAIGNARIADWYGTLIAQLRADLQDIDNIGKRKAALGKLKLRAAVEKYHQRREAAE
jgi:hypothetical protein